MEVNICGCWSLVKKGDQSSRGGSRSVTGWGKGGSATTRSAIPTTAARSVLAASSAVCSPLVARCCVRVHQFASLTQSRAGLAVVGSLKPNKGVLNSLCSE